MAGGRPHAAALRAEGLLARRAVSFDVGRRHAIGEAGARSLGRKQRAAGQKRGVGGLAAEMAASAGFGFATAVGFVGRNGTRAF